MSWSDPTGASTQIGATDDPDAFTGTTGNDSADGLGGDDFLAGGSGDDSLLGGDGNDLVDADDFDDTAGNDTVDGGTGDDAIYSYAGTDSLIGGDGFDYLELTRLNNGAIDYLVSIDGANNLSVSDGTTATGFESFVVATAGGNDTLLAGPGGADLNGNGGNDSIIGGASQDFLRADRVDDVSGNDTVDGGGGDDFIYSYAGTDSLIGGGGFDDLTISRVNNGAVNYLATVDGANTLTLSDGTTAIGFERFIIVTGDGNDTILSGAQGDFIDAGAGNDTLSGGAGSDQIFGGDDNDTISDNANGGYFDGGRGDDVISVTLEGATELSDRTVIAGDEGNDSLVASGPGLDYLGDRTGARMQGGAGNDTIIGSDVDDATFGGDELYGDADNDVITGGAGNDTIDAGRNNDLVIWRVGDGNDQIDMGSGTDTLDLEGWTGTDSDFWTVTGNVYTYNDGAGNTATLTASGVETVTCFAAGTRILTPRGEVPVETLRAGDLVVVHGAGTPFQPLRWVGHTRIDLRRHRAPEKVAPILLRAGALGAGTPHRDLRVSPDHAFLLQGRLVPARLLVNGTTIVQESLPRALTYWHIELDAHGIVVAEGALTESYLDDGNRHLFDNGAIVALDPDFGAGREAGRYVREACAPPILEDADADLHAIRAALPAVVPRPAEAA